jgi:signal transduction histidine kinase
MCPSALNPPRTDAGGDPLGGDGRPSAHDAETADRDDGTAFPAGFDLDSFHDELRQRNVSTVVWTASVFTPIYLAWSVFDRFLLPDQWTGLLGIRLIAVVCVAVTAVLSLKVGPRRYTFEGFWFIALFFGGFVGLMLPAAGSALLPYIMGFSIVLLGAGILPVWPLRWAISLMVLSVGIAVAAIATSFDPEVFPLTDLVAGSFVIATAVGLSLAASALKYDLVKRDFINRMELAAVAKRESQARAHIAEVSGHLQEALEKLREVDRLKSEFFANISHELRTPLTLIVAPVEELERTVDDVSVRQQLRVVRRNAERLLWLINDLLDLAQLDAGGLRLNLDDMDIRTVAATVHDNSQPAARTRGVRLELDTDPSERTIWGDAHRLEIVITNLVSNAIKFTPSGGRVLIRVRDLDGRVRVEIEDNGPGISTEDQPRVFERFFRSDRSDRRRGGGVGIGLALAKELVELHGGGIGVESELGRYTIFGFEIPFGHEHVRPDAIERRRQFVPERPLLRRQDDPDPGEAVFTDEPTPVHLLDDSVSIRGESAARILLVEDHGEVREFIRSLLEPTYRVTTAQDGDEALRIIRSEHPDLVISDVMMPNVSGTELSRLLKADPMLRTIPVILLTARVGSEATLEAYAHGADDFVAKPFHPQVLLARIRAQLKLRALSLQVVQQEKLSAIGTLAAGVLHEVRNPLNSILNAARVLSSGTDTETAGRLLEVIRDGAVRIDGIASALDAHVRPAESGAPGSCDVHEGLDATLRLLGHRMADVTVHRDYQTDRIVAAPASPLNQVFLNLVDNALRVGARTLWIRTSVRGDRVTVTIGDDGPGVAPGLETKIFDPFFTNRPDGSGTGLGLYLSRRIVDEYGGSLTLGRRAGGGAEFTVEIPTADAMIDGVGSHLTEELT